MDARRLEELDSAAAAAQAVDGMQPRVVATPRTAAEVAEALKELAARRLTMAPRGGASKMGLGNPPSSLDAILDMRGVAGVVDYTPADLTVTAQAGTVLATLQQELGAHGQMLALDPPFADQATIGGILATNDSGPRRLGYGTARDLVIGTTVVCPDGRVTRAGGKVVKNVTGYDLNKLYIGSLGTLAVLVDVSFKLHPLPGFTRTVWASFARAAEAMSVVARLIRSPLEPIALMLNDMRGSNLADGDRAPLRLHVEFAGSPASVTRKTDEAARYCAEAGAKDTSVIDEGGVAAWSGMREHPQSFGSEAGARLKVTVPVMSVAAIMDAAQERAAAGDLRCWVISFAGNGVVYVYLDGGSPVLYASIVGELRLLAGSAGGSVVVQEGSLALKRLVDVWGPTPPGIGVMRSLKATFDPRGMLNPGRFVGGI